MNLPDGFDAWAAWLGLAVALGVLELFSLDLILLMLAAGAIVGMLVSLTGVDLWVQVVAAVVASVAALGVVRPSVVKRLHTGPNLVLGHEALVGRQGLVVQEVSSQAGQIRVGGEIWTARPYDDDQVIPVGAKVDIFQIKGATALVHHVPELG
ncbi:NfeD family protein [Nocardioides panacis]|uniref:NfeD family protein n=1 Tax=Nocardioides panacis TaxID=2849501 RepID=A0A975T2E2_9ACTN|nr:NfeD family protein [Nocardioides panacis]QWZ09618.1 NfeD family protein [Nocardioides panacis]